jgi:hypothetical protein
VIPVHHHHVPPVHRATTGGRAAAGPSISSQLDKDFHHLVKDVRQATRTPVPPTVGGAVEAGLIAKGLDFLAKLLLPNI